MADCKWNKVRFKSFSLSEWRCATCGETGYAPHERPPANCLRRVFGIKARYKENESKRLFDKIKAIKVGSNGLPLFLVVPFIVLLAALLHFQCNIYSLIGFANSVCNSIDLVDEIYNNDAADGLRETDGKPGICSASPLIENNYIDYADVEEYLGMLRKEIELLDNAINGSSQEYEEGYSSFLIIYKIRDDFFHDKLYKKCYGGADNWRIATEIEKMRKFILAKADTLYNLSYNLSKD